jgi:hypothetical protein
MRYSALLIFVATLAGCSTTPVSRSDVSTLMAIQQQAWNEGDLEKFVSYYDPSMTFCGSSGVTRGIGNLLTRYQTKYPTAKERGSLTFQVVDYRPLAGDAALVVGKYALKRDNPSSGYFTLVLARMSQGVRIIHDHTSESPRIP